jgi:hypothetical protein
MGLICSRTLPISYRLTSKNILKSHKPHKRACCVSGLYRFNFGQVFLYSDDASELSCWERPVTHFLGLFVSAKCFVVVLPLTKNGILIHYHNPSCFKPVTTQCLGGITGPPCPWGDINMGTWPSRLGESQMRQ